MRRRWQHLPARHQGAAQPARATPVLLCLIVYTFTLVDLHAGERAPSKERGQRVDRDRRRGPFAPVARASLHAFLPPYFLPPQQIGHADIDRRMDTGRYTFVVDIPPRLPARPRRPAASPACSSTSMPPR